MFRTLVLHALQGGVPLASLLAAPSYCVRVALVGATSGRTRAPLHAAPAPPAVLGALVGGTLGTFRAPVRAAPGPPVVLDALVGGTLGTFFAHPSSFFLKSNFDK
eukprot:3699608-Pyramimonas_sp.AAC.1